MGSGGGATAADVLLLSNGHGEDLSGARLGTELQRRGHRVEALPLVGHGAAYREAGLPVLGRARSYSTGGLGYTSLSGRITEVAQGQLLYLLSCLVRLLRIAHRYRLILVVGDVIPVLAAWLSRRPFATYLVAYSSHYEGRLRLPWPCMACLRSHRSLRLYARDQLSADDLSRQLGRAASFLGNPFFDGPAPSSVHLQGSPRQRLALLPGSRLPEAQQNLTLMLQLLEQLPQNLQQPMRLGLHAALVQALSLEEVAHLGRNLGWELHSAGEGRWHLQRGPLQVQLEWERFPAVVQQCDLVVAMAGTASEQCVGLGKPVLQLSGRGPQFTAGFAEAQRRLLGPGVFCGEGAPGSDQQRRSSAQLLENLLERLERDPDWRNALRQEGLRRIGAGGGAARMVNDLHPLLQDHRHG
jgi:uncharacterized protein (TIGR03492 family)